ncbi:aromatic acid exporter family protein [Salicibibacter cibi]|uniref:Aromatic acid exporter family protein n=1 Tax=Salicibibacter cibi TaxID=2743001 RepID=A0A7T6Z808_9BACI|nr:aromatic acid exporter family protein [Salicibibacter cibi]QQK78658.1 aromatic acid exporter family protein [Salicibibacter cibi]
MFFGYRTLKTAVGAGISLLIAQWLQLDFFASAAIITVLCITVTKKGSVSKAWELFLASCAGLLYSAVIFEMIGYHPLSIAILILVFIPTLQKIKALKGVINSIVIISHVYTVGEITPGVLMNEFLLITIGGTVGLIMNIYMPSIDEDLYQDQLNLEEQFSRIWKEYARYLRDQRVDWDGREITRASELIEDGKSKALRSMDNYFLRHDNYFYHYFEMRGRQFAIIERILPFVSALDKVDEGKLMANFMDGLSSAVQPGNTASYYLEELKELRETFKQHPLPETRTEFETRASLFYILHELEQYLLIKDMFKPDRKRTLDLKRKKRARTLRKREKKNQ